MICQGKDAKDEPARQGGREESQRRFRDIVKQDMQVVGMTVEDEKGRLRWKYMICCGDL